MKIQVPFLALFLATLTNFDLVLGIPAPNGPKHIEPGHKSLTHEIGSKNNEVAEGSHVKIYREHDIEAALQDARTPREAWVTRIMSPQEKKALDKFLHRPKTKEDVAAIRLMDFPKITHQDHLNELDADGAAHIAGRLVKHSRGYLKDRKDAFKAIQQHGGDPGKIGTGRPEAEEHHLRHANAQRALNQLKGPLTAAEHIAYSKGEFAHGSAAYRHKQAIFDEWKSGPEGTNAEFEDHIGRESTYHPYEQLPNKVEDNGAVNVNNGGKSINRLVATSRL
jgi:hypothetical protein